MSSNWDRIFAALCDNEGFTACNDAHDHGGTTSPFGIASASWPRQYAEIMSLPANQRKKYAEQFYIVNFWLPCGVDLLADANVAYQVFDHAVNAGLGSAVNVIVAIQAGLNRAFGCELKQDGVLGPVTKAAINAHPGVAWLCAVSKRKDIYEMIALNGPTQAEFLASWLTRTARRFA